MPEPESDRYSFTGPSQSPCVLSSESRHSTVLPPYVTVTLVEQSKLLEHVVCEPASRAVVRDARNVDRVRRKVVHVLSVVDAGPVAAVRMDTARAANLRVVRVHRVEDVAPQERVVG